MKIDEVQHLAEEVASTFYVTVEEITSPTRRADVVDARYVFMWLLRYHHRLTYESIGRYAHRDHTTVIHGVRKVESRPDLVHIARGVIARIDTRSAA